METVILRENANGVSQAAALLQATEAVGLPTETVYGLAADALNPDAVARIYQAKGRPSDNPLIVHVTGPDQAAQLAAAIPPAARRLMDEFWPGPLTIVLPKTPPCPISPRADGQMSDSGHRPTRHFKPY